MKVKTKSRKVNKAWLNDHVHDPYVKLAQKEGYRARAAYKLKEIDESLGLIRPGQVVVDLGSAPGAWSQYLRRRFAPRAVGAGGAAVGELDPALEQVCRGGMADRDKGPVGRLNRGLAGDGILEGNPGQTSFPADEVIDRLVPQHRDVRVGEEPITAEFALRLGRAAGQVLRQRFERPRVLIGKDTRLSGYMLESALEAGLSAAGADVVLLGPMPTPAVAFLTRSQRASAGIVISASHNPYEDNGIKFFSADGEKLEDAVELAIEAALSAPAAMVSRDATWGRLGPICATDVVPSIA